MFVGAVNLAAPQHCLPLHHPATIDLTGWGLVDTTGGRKDLTGTFAGQGGVQVTASRALQLGNQGDTVVLVDPGSSSIDQLIYEVDRVRPGGIICLAADAAINSIDSEAVQGRAHPYQQSRAERYADRCFPW
jgi:hypothetical protein